VKSLKYLSLVASAILLHCSIGSTIAGCLPVTTLWDIKATNVARCGLEGLVTNDTFYSFRKDEAWQSKEVAQYSGGVAVRYQIYEKTYGYGLVNSSTNCYQSGTNWATVNIPFSFTERIGSGNCTPLAYGACVADLSHPPTNGCNTIGPGTYGECFEVFDILLKSYLDGGTLTCTNGWRTTNITLQASDSIDDRYSAYHLGYQGNCAGTYTNRVRVELSQPYTLGAFAADTLAVVNNAWRRIDTGGDTCTVFFLNPTDWETGVKRKWMNVQFARYYLRFKGEAGVDYVGSWKLRKVTANSTNVVGGGSWSGKGTGTEITIGPFEAPNPELGESYVVEVYDKDFKIDPNSPSGPGATSTECGFASCGAGGGTHVERPGEGQDYLDSASFMIFLGAGNADGLAGVLSMREETPSAALATPGVLKMLTNASVTTVTTNGDGSVDVAAPTMLARIVVSNSYAYRIYCSATNFTGGGYLTNSPFVTHLLVNPNGSTNYNTLQHIYLRSSGAITNEFTCETNSPTNVTWRLVSGNGLRGERLAKIANTNNTRLESYSVFEPGNQSELYRRDRIYWTLQWADFLLSEIIDPGGLHLTTTNTYDSQGRLLTSLLPNGSWLRHEYETNGLLLRTVRPLTNQPPTAAANDCRVTEYGYVSVSGSPDNQSYHVGEPRTVTERIQGQPVSTSMFAYSGNNTYIRRSTNPGTSWGDASNENTSTALDNQSRVTQIDYPDGTRTKITYSDSSAGRLTTSKTGVIVGTEIYPGTKTVQQVDLKGRLVATTNYDISVSQTERITSREIYSEPDGLGWPTKITYLDGSTSTAVRQDCCQAAYAIDRDGVASTNSYDALNRLVANVRLKITNSTVLDAAHRPLVFKRTGTNGTTITLRGLVYDAAGRVIRETNALQGVTTYSQSVDANNQFVSLASYPDGGARTEVYFRDGNLAFVTNSAVFPVRYEYGAETNGGYARAFTKEIKLTTNLTDSGEWTKTYSDGVGRSYLTVFPGGSSPYRQSFYNSKGQLWKERDPDGVITLYTNNAVGDRAYAAMDSNRNDTIDFNGLDRITQTTNDVVDAHGTTVRRTRTYVWGTNNNSTATLLTTSEVSVDGLNTWQTNHSGAGSVFSSSATIIPTSANNWTRTVTQTLPDNSTIVSVYQYGRLLSVTRKDSTGAQIGATTYGYDAHGRQYAVYDARNGWTTFAYNNADQIVTVTTPAPGNGASPQTTTTFYDNMLRAAATRMADGGVVTNEFYLNGLRKKTWGSRTYPVEYTYDYAGRMSTMKTWQNFAADSGAAVTTWNYDTNRGWFSNKRYADGYGPDYTYTDAGKLSARLWARSVSGNRVTTTYSYNNAGEMEGVSYNDSTTPNVSYSYDRRGRVVQLGRNGITTTLTYGEGGQLLREAYTGGTLDGLSITNIYDSLLRRTNVSVKNGTIVLTGTGYSYDNASRFLSVTDGTNSATYSYAANSPLVGQIEFKNNGTTRMTTTKQYDALNRLSTINSQPSSDTAVSFAYDYNSANQRTRVTLADGSYWVYTYDALGQVTSGRKYWGDGSLVAGQQFDYSFDDIGNRKQTRAGGDEHGNGKRVANYTVNDLNQYTQRDVPGAFDVMGVARGTVTVNGSGSGVHRKTEYFRKELSVNNSLAPQYQTVDVTATDGTSLTETGGVYVAKTPEVFGYDLDGNMTNDGRWIFKWDAENRLIEAKTIPGVPLAAERRLAFEYDNQGRRIRKTVYDRAEGGTLLSEQKFIYDRWNLLATLDETNTVQQSFRWGTDLSGTMQGAGGVGGLLSITIHTGTNAGVSFFGYDGNGNVASLVSAANGSIGAQYEHDPFGRMIRATGPLALANSFRFSTKFTDDETHFSYFGYRFYNPTGGRWLSRDPIKERGFERLHSRPPSRLVIPANLYAFLRNTAQEIDFLGLADLPIYIPPYEFPGPPIPPIGPAPSAPYDNCCCTPQRVLDGEIELNTRYKEASDYLRRSGAYYDPDGVGRGVSCLEAAHAILQFMSPTPPCWTCFIENRQGRLGGLGWDENAIVCTSRPNRGTSRAIVFDWFDVQRGISTPGESYDEYARRYVRLNERTGTASFEDCSRSTTTAKPRNLDPLKGIL